MLKYIIIALLFSLKAIAADNQILQSLLPTENQHELQATVLYEIAKVDFSTAGESAEQKTSGLSLEYRYGFAQNNALGINLNYNNTDSTFSMQPNGKSKGLTNPKFLYKGLTEINNYTLFYSATYSLGIEKQKSNLDTSEDNQAEGQNTLSLEFGTHSQFANKINLGILTNFSKKFDGERVNISTSTESTVKLKGGDSTLVSLFLETTDNLHINGSIGYKKTSSTETIFANTTTSKSDELSLVIISGSLRYSLNNNFTLIPQLTITTGSGDDYLSKYDSYLLQIGSRYLF